MTDADYLSRALELASRALGRTRPNPPVGAVVVRSGRILGEGYHHCAGGDHAEVEALKACRRPPRGATVYVTLEPCSKPGRVGACTDALIAAGVSRVVYAVPDPNPVNRGRAKRILSKAGIACVDFSKVQPDAPVVAGARRLIAPFAKHVRTGLPYVTVKLAMSLDGRTCDRYGKANWISSADSRRRTGDLRRTCDAIMVGAETIRRDNPSLLWHEGSNPNLLRVVVSRSGRLPAHAQVFTDGRNETLVFRSPKAALRALGRRGCLHVLCEGGVTLAGALAGAGLVDEWLTVLAPIVIGSGRVSRAFRFPKAGDLFIRVDRGV